MSISVQKTGAVQTKITVSSLCNDPPAVSTDTHTGGETCENAEGKRGNYRFPYPTVFVEPKSSMSGFSPIFTWSFCPFFHFFPSVTIFGRVVALSDFIGVAARGTARGGGGKLPSQAGIKVSIILVGTRKPIYYLAIIRSGSASAGNCGRKFWWQINLIKWAHWRSSSHSMWYPSHRCVSEAHILPLKSHRCRKCVFSETRQWACGAAASSIAPSYLYRGGDTNDNQWLFCIVQQTEADDETQD